jgi:hypothetical protein
LISLYRPNKLSHLPSVSFWFKESSILKPFTISLGHQLSREAARNNKLVHLTGISGTKYSTRQGMNKSVIYSLGGQLLGIKAQFYR